LRGDPGLRRDDNGLRVSLPNKQIVFTKSNESRDRCGVLESEVLQKLRFAAAVNRLKTDWIPKSSPGQIRQTFKMRRGVPHNADIRLSRPGV
jgi:hypothetical protein